MIAAIGWYCFVIGVLQGVLLLATSTKLKPSETDAYKHRRVLIWVSHPIFLLATVVAWRAS